MTNEGELRDRDERARDRDELSRGRDELARDQDLLSQMRTRSARNVQTWATVVLIIMVASLFYTISERNHAISELQSAAVRIEQAAVHTEEVLVGIVDNQQTPESQAQAQRVREALIEIGTIHRLLCEFPELANTEECLQRGG